MVLEQYILGWEDDSSYDSIKRDMLKDVMGNTKTPAETIDFVVSKG